MKSYRTNLSLKKILKMFIKPGAYEVVIEPFAKRHFIKTFSKKYKKAWDVTLIALIREFQSFDVILERNIAEEITDKNANLVIAKTEFVVAGTQQSRHASGNRCIVAKDKSKNRISMLLVYHKNDLGEGNETSRWRGIIKENYPEYRSLL